MSDDKELIEKARRLEENYGGRYEVMKHMSALADALEARKPSEGDRTPEFEANEQELFKHQPVLSMDDGSIRGCQCMDRVFCRKTEDWGTHLAEVFDRLSRAAVPDAATEAKQPEGWSTEDRREAKCEAERRWSRPVVREADYQRQSGTINGFILGAEWQKARETFISYRAIADEALAERDAALAAVERCRALVAEWKHEGPSGPFPDRIAIDVGVEVIEPLLAALDGAPEPETPELFPGTNAALDRLTVSKAAPAEAFCIEHGNFHAVELGDPTCEFEDGFGEPVVGETDG